MIQVLMLSDGRGLKSLYGYWSDKDRTYVLYERKYINGKYCKTIIAMFDDFQRMLYIAGDIAKLNAYCEE